MSQTPTQTALGRWGVARETRAFRLFFRLAAETRTRDRDRDLTVKGSRHLTFHITVKLTIKEEMLNLTCRQTFSFTQARPD